MTFPPEFELEKRIRLRAADCGIELSATRVDALAAHARAVLRSNRELRLTAITEPDPFLERHLGEAFEGAAMIDENARGLFVDIGSGNGYPSLPLVAARPELELKLAEASPRKSSFLRGLLGEIGWDGAAVREGQVQRAADLDDLAPIRLLTTRGMGGWAKILPRLVPCLAEQGEILVWSGEEMETVRTRAVWRKLRLADRKALPHREHSWIWRFRAV